MTRLRPATLAAQAAQQVGQDGAAIVPGIERASTYLRDAANQPISGRTYARDQNATVKAVEHVISRLEGAAQSRVFPSGMAAVAAVLRSIPTGGRLIMQTNIYWNATKFARDFCARRNITLDEVDCSDPAKLEAACARKANLVWVETPSNPWLRVTDIYHASQAAKCVAICMAFSHMRSMRNGSVRNPRINNQAAWGSKMAPADLRS